MSNEPKQCSFCEAPGCDLVATRATAKLGICLICARYAVHMLLGRAKEDERITKERDKNG